MHKFRFFFEAVGLLALAFMSFVWRNFAEPFNIFRAPSLRDVAGPRLSAPGFGSGGLPHESTVHRRSAARNI